MAGVKVPDVIRAIANIVALIEFSVNVYGRKKDISQDANEVPKAFRNTSEVLPLVKSAYSRPNRV
jgi:hypothetical protein